MADDEDGEAVGLHGALRQVDEALSRRFASIEAECRILRARCEQLRETLNKVLSNLGKPSRFTLSVATENGVILSTTPPAVPTILDNDTTQSLIIEFTDALGFVTSDPSATVVATSSDTTIANVGTVAPGTITDPTTGATVDVLKAPITPVAPGSVSFSVNVTNTDGSTVTGAPLACQIDPSAPTGVSLSIGT
jgi:hypothetical protein